MLGARGSGLEAGATFYYLWQREWGAGRWSVGARVGSNALRVTLAEALAQIQRKKLSAFSFQLSARWESWADG